MIEFSNILYEIIVWLFLVYSAFIFVIYSWVGIYAFGALRRYQKYNEHTDYSLIARNPNAPVFSIIAPAYNEGMTIVENARSLLSLYYPNLEIIIVNDGSKDDSIERLIDAYQLERVAYHVEQTIPTREIRGVYRSRNRAFQRLIVVDKVNGGKADALNVGINVAKGDYLVCIDVDCILEQDAILKLAKPFMDQTEERVIACGGVIRLANNCRIENGKVVDVNLPQSWLGRFQALEYIRAFVLGRMAWSRASGLILISGAFGVFDKKIVMACGGYDSKTVGEDMELVVRMRRYMEERNESYKVINIPDPLCWTEVPESDDILKKQRNRWMRGTIETLWKHRKMMFNPRYGRLGMVSLPYWFFFEFLGPLVEFTGFCIFILFLILGIINWPFFFLLTALVLASGILYSIYAILVDLLSDQVYTKRKDLATLLLTAVLEPFFFHGKVVMAGVSGVRDYFRKQQGWGEMKRQGFQQARQGEGLWQRVVGFLSWTVSSYTPLALTFLTLFMISVSVEALWYSFRFKEQFDSGILFSLFADNAWFALQFSAVTALAYGFISFITVSWSKMITVILFTGVLTLNYLMFLYFSESHNLLGADVFFYSRAEINHILRTSGILTYTNIALLVFVVVISILPLILVSKRIHKNAYTGVALILTGLISLFIPKGMITPAAATSAWGQSAGTSKWKYYAHSNATYFFNNHPEVEKWLFKDTGSDQVSSDYPFLREEDAVDVLGPYLQKSTAAPNLVLIIVEGLGHAYSSPQGYVGNFTPYLDSLKQQSLFWKNNLSSSGRTFSVLPTLLGSLPFASNGFLDQKEYPLHFNLWNVLKKNGFKTGFYYGGDASFDFMERYARESGGIDEMVDMASFDGSYRKLPGKDGTSWGYEDQAVLKNMLSNTASDDQPYFNVLLTLSTHSPFLINDASRYEKMVEQRIAQLKLAGQQREDALTYKKQLATVMNIDAALKDFMTEYSRREDFSNTIFVITGDHAMPEIALSNKIDRYHVPLLIYSPLLKTGATFNHIVSHFDLAPSILAYYRKNYDLETPQFVTWLGKGLHAGASVGGIPIMQSKYQQEDFIVSNYHYNNKSLFKLDYNLNEEESEEDSRGKFVKQQFDDFMLKNREFIKTRRLVPDSIFNGFFK